MGKVSDRFKSVIKEYLNARADEDLMFASVYGKENKTLDECCDYIVNVIKESGRMGFADDEIFGLAVHYYQEDDIKDVPKAPKCNIVVNLSDQTKEQLERQAEEEYKAQKIAELKAKEAKAEETRKRRVEAAKKKDEEIGQLSLFGL